MTGIYELYIGTYTQPIKFGTGQILDGKGEGIYCFSLDAQSGKLDLKHVTPAANPSYLAISSDKRFLYCVNELKQYNGMDGGSASAYAVERDGRLRFLNAQPTKGGDPCHISVDKSGSCVFAANFMSGSMCMFLAQKDGDLQEASAFFQHSGSGPDPVRQKGPHAHAVVLSPDERYVLTPDLGTDKIMVYALDAARGSLSPAGEIPLESGDGPRQCVFHPSKPDILYVINELALSIGVFAFDSTSGTAVPVQRLPIVSAIGKDSIGADIQITPAGEYLYASVRGNDIIAAYKVDSKTALLSPAALIGSGGKTPRSFAISPDGRFLVAGNQDTDCVAVFGIDRATGSLTQLSETFVPTPVCVKFTD